MKLYWEIFHTHQPKRALSPWAKKLIWDWAFTDPTDTAGPSLFLVQAIKNEVTSHGIHWTGSIADLMEPNSPTL